MSDAREVDLVDTHCEWCGAEFDLERDAPVARTPATKPAPVDADEPVTHCEWRGAEYPVPETS